MNTHTLTMLLAFATVGQSAFAATKIGLKGIGGRVGVVLSEEAPTVGLVADLGKWSENLPMELAISYWKSDGGGSLTSPSTVTIANVAMRGAVAYMFELGQRLLVYPGAGLGVHRSSFSGGPGGSGDPDYDLSLVILGGLQFPLTGNWHGQTEFQFDFFDFGGSDQSALQFDFIYELRK